MKVIIIEYATLISEKLHKNPDFERHITSLMDFGFNIRVIYSYNPEIKNPSFRTATEFRSFLQTCPSDLSPFHESSIVLTGEPPRKLRAIRNDKLEGQSCPLPRKQKG